MKKGLVWEKVNALYLARHHIIISKSAEPNGSVSSIEDMRTGGCWFDSWARPLLFQGLMMVIATGFIPLSPPSIISTMFMLGKQPVAWKEYCWECWVKELQESIDRSTGCHDITQSTDENGF